MLGLSPNVLGESTRRGHVPFLVAAIPAFFSRNPRPAHKLCEPDTFDIWEHGGVSVVSKFDGGRV